MAGHDGGDRLRMGVVGTGSLGFHHARILRDLDGVEMVGIHDVRPERADEVSRELGVAAHGTLEGLLDRTRFVRLRRAGRGCLSMIMRSSRRLSTTGRPRSG